MRFVFVLFNQVAYQSSTDGPTIIHVHRFVSTSLTVSGCISTNIDRIEASLPPLKSGGQPIFNGGKLASIRSIFVEIRHD